MAEILGGEAASLREAPLPPDPSLPKSGWRLGWWLLRCWFRLRVGAGFCELVVVTAADRAAATLRCGGNETPPPAYGGHLPFQGRLCRESCQKAPSAEGAVSRKAD